MNPDLLWLVTLLIYLFIIAALVVFRSARSLSQSPQIHPLSENEPRDRWQWAVDQGFEYVGTYSVSVCTPPAVMFVWGNPRDGLFFTQTQVLAVTDYTFASTFSSEVSLATSTCTAAHGLVEPPGSYSQAFPGLDLDSLWRRHIEGIDYLARAGAVSTQSPDAPFEQLFLRATHRHAAFIRSRFLWQLRVPFELLLRSRRWRNLTIEQQHRRGWIKLPNELPPGPPVPA